MRETIFFERVDFFFVELAFFILYCDKWEGVGDHVRVFTYQLSSANDVYGL